MALDLDGSETETKSQIPERRSFQSTTMWEFTESRRQRFLSLRKQNREAHFGSTIPVAVSSLRALSCTYCTLFIPPPPCCHTQAAALSLHCVIYPLSFSLCAHSLSFYIDSERARKIALNADRHSDHDSNSENGSPPRSKFDFSFHSIPFHTDFESDTVSKSKPPRLPRNDPDDVDKCNTIQSMGSTQNEHKSVDKTKRKSGGKSKGKKKGKSQRSKSSNSLQNGRASKAAKARASRMKYAEMLMVHEWMIDIPHDLSRNVLCPYPPSIALSLSLSRGSLFKIEFRSPCSGGER